MIETIRKNEKKRIKVSQGYKTSSTDYGYSGEVGDYVYDCEYWMMILIKEQ